MTQGERYALAYALAVLAVLIIAVGFLSADVARLQRITAPRLILPVRDGAKKPPRAEPVGVDTSDIDVGV